MVPSIGKGGRGQESTEHYSFHALRGIQAGREYYVVMCPLRIIPKIFLFNETELPPELRAQRALNKSRIPEMVDYLTRPAGGYVFSSITASIDGPVSFTPVEDSGPLSRVGTLAVAMSARFLINDGQHRRAAIEHALSKKPELGLETISVVFYLDAGLKNSQQMFSDLNKHAVKPTTSLNILYDHQDAFSRTIVSILDEVPIFANGLTELEKTSISNRVTKVFTLNSIYSATKALLGKTENRPIVSDSERKLAIEFWNEVYANISEWKNIVNGERTPFDARQEYVNVYGVALHAIGIAGHDLVTKYPKTWKSKIRVLQKVNWSRSNTQEWEGRALIGGRLTKIRNNIILTSNLLKKKLEIPLNQNEDALEKTLRKNKVTARV